MKRLLFCDTETFSEVDIGKCGSYRYIEDNSTEILLLTYAFDDEPVKIADLASGDQWPEEFLEAYDDPETTIIAHNCSGFEWPLFNRFLHPLPAERYLDTMHLVAQCGLPLSLGAAGDAIGLSEDKAKIKDGKALIRFFSLPCKPTKSNGMRERNFPEHDPEKWSRFCEYAIRDVETMRTIFRHLERWMPNEDERRFWCLDARINNHGVRIDRKLATNAVLMDTKNKEELTAEAIALTGLENPKSVSQVKNWLFDQEGQEFPSLNKKVLADVVSNLKSDEAKKFMDIRTELSKSSTAKYNAMLRAMSPKDDHVRGCFKFYGANRTGRFAGSLVQFQNLSKNYDDCLDDMRTLVRDGHYTALKAIYGGVADPLSQLVRTAIIPEEGHKILVADFSAIEARVTAWFADEKWRLETFRNGGDIYCQSASMMFHVPVVKHGENGHLRQKGKIAELALGYGGGVNALKAFGADKMGMTEEEMQEVVDKWREASPNVCDWWKSMERAAIRAVVKKTGTIDNIGKVLFDYENGVLWMTLPSGRRLAYWGAAYDESRFHPGRKSLSYMGVNQQTKKWSRVETWGGKLVENCWAGDTLVLTDSGWKKITLVTTCDRVWDGLAFVDHFGVACRGDKEVVDVNGARCTPDHEILTVWGWRCAKTCDGLGGVPVQLPDDYRTKLNKGLTWSSSLGGGVFLWEKEVNRYKGHDQAREAGPSDFMRLYEKEFHIRVSEDTWYDETPCVWSMAQHDTALYRSIAQSVEKLRWSWNNRVRKMASQLREFLEGHGLKLSAWSGLRSDRQQRWVLHGELSVDDEKTELQQQTGEYKGSTRSSVGAISDDGAIKIYDLLPPKARVPYELTVRATGRKEPVYDILNCGPRHRFTILTEDGPLIVHNCVQATSRDILREAMFSLEKEGYQVIAHVHDECIVTEPYSSGRTYNDMAETMCPDIPWAKGLPLEAAGYDGDYYFKD